jgi:ubiquitin-activating enzyme E1 C
METFSNAPHVHSQIKRPSLSVGSKQLFMQGPPQLREATAPNLEKPLQDLMASGSDVTVTDSALPFSLVLRVTLS